MSAWLYYTKFRDSFSFSRKERIGRKPPRKVHPCQGIRFADSLRSGDMRKVPRWLRTFNTMLIQLIIYGRPFCSYLRLPFGSKAGLCA